MRPVTKCLVLLLGCLPFTGIAQDKGNISILFQPRFNQELLEPGKECVLSQQDTITIHRFKFYVSNIEWLNETGSVLQRDNGYYLINMEDPSSLQINIERPTGSVASLRLLIGVDSLRNVSGVQSGALDPLHGMFWTWNSGYVMAKIEGTANRSVQAGRRFTFHVGGFKQHQAAQRQVTLPIQRLTDVLQIAADARTWFGSQHSIDLKTEAACHSPGALAQKLADNYSTMFTIIDP